jgi:hypothetical protein
MMQMGGPVANLEFSPVVNVAVKTGGPPKINDSFVSVPSALRACYLWLTMLWQALQSATDFFSMGYSKYVYEKDGSIMNPLPPRYTQSGNAAGASDKAGKVKYNFYPNQSTRSEDTKGSNVFPYTQTSSFKMVTGEVARRGKYNWRGYARGYHL